MRRTRLKSDSSDLGEKLLVVAFPGHLIADHSVFEVLDASFKRFDLSLDGFQIGHPGPLRLFG